MNKYTPEQLKEKALILIRAKQNGDERYFQFLMTVAIRTGLPTPQIEQKIYEFANAGA